MGKKFRSQTVEPPNEQGSPESATQQMRSSRSIYKISIDNPINYKKRELSQRSGVTPDKPKSSEINSSNSY